MKIQEIKTYVTKVKLKDTFGFSQWYYSEKYNLIVKIVTDEGIFGLGECYGPAKVIKPIIDDLIKPKLINRDPLLNENIWNDLYKSTLDFSRKGIIMSAISGIDIALWDIKAKFSSLPLYKLLGGSDNKIPCYGTGMYFPFEINESETITKILKEGDNYIKQGFDFLKIKIGKNIDFDKKLIKEFRKAFPKIILSADANHAYSYKEALVIGKILEENNYYWFEEPVSPDNLEAYSNLRNNLSIHIAGGECEQTRYGFRQMLEKSAVDIIQPDISYSGGLTEFQKIHGLALSYNTDILPHIWGLKINQAVGASAITIIQDNPGRYENKKKYMEYDLTEHPVRDEVFITNHKFENGYFYLSDEPGIGINLNKTKLEKYLI